MHTTSKRGVPTREVCTRYGVKHPRTIRRWEIQRVIPPADFVINGRKYWWESTLDKHDRRAVAARALPSPRARSRGRDQIPTA
jgi:hypothetical protein